MSEELDINELDPGIRRVVALLREWGFDTTDSGDGVSKGDFADGSGNLDFPHVHMEVKPSMMVAEADRLFSLLKTIGIPMDQQTMDGSSPCIQADYDPATETASITLMHLSGAGFLGGVKL